MYKRQILENGKMRKGMGKEHSSGLTETSMRGYGRMIKDMGKEHTPGPMGTSMSENGRMTKETV